MKLRLGFKSRSDIGTGSAICSIWLCRRAIRKSWRKGLTFCCWCGGFRWSESDASQWRGILFPVNPSSLWRQHQTRGGTPLGSVVFDLNDLGSVFRIKLLWLYLCQRMKHIVSYLIPEPRLFFYRSIFIGVIRLIKIEVMILSVWKWQFSLKSLLIVIIWSTIETQTGWRGPLIQAHLS